MSRDEIRDRTHYPREQPAGSSSRHAVWLLIGLVVIAVVLRFWRLGDWNFQATEMFTLRDSTTPQFSNPRPLGYLLNYYLVHPFRALDEFGMRLLPAVFGVLAIPTLYLVSRPIIGTRAALFAALLLTFSPLHILYSQLARYWSLVFFLSAVFPFALYVGVRDRSVRWLILGAVTAVLAALAHPVALLLFGGPAIGFLVVYLRQHSWRELWGRRNVRWAAAGLVILTGALAARSIPLLTSWISQHDKNPGSSAFLLPATNPGLKQAFYVLSFVDSLTLPLFVIALLGGYLLWRNGQRTLALFLITLAAFPIAFFTLLSLRTPVSQYYLVPAAPVFFICAGVFLAWLSRQEWRGQPRWLLPGAVTTIVIGAGLPTLISDYRDGRRYNFRQVAQWLESRLSPGDVVFSDQHMVLTHYLPDAEIRKLRETGPLAEALRERQTAEPSRDLWLVAPAASHPFRTNLKRGGLIDWIYGNCQLQQTIGVGRIDFRQHYLQVYRCPPQPAAVLS